MHVRLTEAPRGHGRGADPEARRDERRPGFPWNRVLVDRYSRTFERVLRLLAREFRVAPTEIDHEQMGVRAPADHGKPVLDQPLRKRLRVGDDLALVDLEIGLKSFFERDGLGRNDVHQGPTLQPREDGLVHRFRMLLLTQDHPAPRAAERLMGRGRDDVGVGDRAGMEPRGHEPRDVRHIDHEIGACLPSDVAKRLEIDNSGIGAGAGHDHLRSGLQRLLTKKVVVDAGIRLPHSVRHYLVELAAEVYGRPVSQMATVTQIHPEDRVTRCEQREVGGHVGLGTRVRLNVGMVGREELCGPNARQLLRFIDELTPTVITPPGKPLGVLVGHDRAHGFEDRPRHEILAGNEFEL